jgi:hypothetical protein
MEPRFKKASQLHVSWGSAAPAANADVKSDCEANGGMYSDLVGKDGTHLETCCWQVNFPGIQQCHFWVDGEELHQGPDQTTPPPNRLPTRSGTPPVNQLPPQSPAPAPPAANPG